MSDREANLIKAHEIARALRVGTQTVRDWANRGHMPKPVRIGPRLTMWDANDIKKWIEDRKWRAG